MDIGEVRKTVAQIKGRLFKRSNSYSIGMLKGHFKGSGLQFKDHRPYEQGDEIRFIDWKLLAKTADPYVKTFEEERNVEITVVIDASPTMYAGGHGVSKLQAGIEICCLLYLISQESRDFIHAVVFGDKVIDIPKDTGDRGISLFVSLLQREGILNNKGQVVFDYANKKPLGEEKRYKELLKHLAKRREVVLLSDFHAFKDREALRKIFLRRKVHAFQLLSPVELYQKGPFLIHSKEGSFEERGRERILFSQKKHFQAFFGKNVKRLDVEKRYLDNFVKEMM